ncbi:MAG: 3-methyl-2-oxobutanoate dehydrogenase subunit beta, partial [Methanomethylovorans sp.]|nr:3-methyl-2-oxobutanoate dehydrogenase subunit beta [Methanomethylovorans sp.]
PQIDTSWAVNATEQTRQNLVTSIFLDFEQLEGFNNKLQEKYELIQDQEVDYEEYMMEDADIILVSYGISSRICRSAVEQARKKGIKAGLFRPITLFPFPEKEMLSLAQTRDCTFICVEMSNGQMRDDVLLATRCTRPVELVNRLGGNLVTFDQVMEKIEYIATGGSI